MSSAAYLCLPQTFFFHKFREIIIMGSDITVASLYLNFDYKLDVELIVNLRSFKHSNKSDFTEEKECLLGTGWNHIHFQNFNDCSLLWNSFKFLIQSFPFHFQFPVESDVFNFEPII